MPQQPGSDAAASHFVIVGAAETGHHIIHIEGYSHTKEQIPLGLCVRIRPFSLCGYSWQLEYYPNNLFQDDADFIALLFVRSLDPDADPQAPRGPDGRSASVRTRVTLSLLDATGQPVPSHTQTMGPVDFHDRFGLSFGDFVNRAWLEESEYLVDDRFTIRCDVVVYTGVRVERRAEPPPRVTVPPSDLHRHFGALLSAKEGADVMFEVAGEKFSAHRWVLGARSTVFKAELFGMMKESMDPTAIIRVDDMEAEVFRALLAFVYTDTLPDSPKMKGKEEAAMAQHLLVAADRYDLERLKLICEDKLCKHINTGTVATILALAEQHNCPGLKKACLHFLGSSSTLNDVIATESFEHLARSCPSVMKELISNVSTPLPTDLGEASQRDVGLHAMFSLARQTSHWCRVMVMVVLSVVSSLKGGNAPLACLCLVVAFLCGYKLTEKLI